MVLVATAASKHARLHVRRRTALFDRIGWLCAACGTGAYRTDFLHVDHINGDRNGANTKVEMQRLLRLPLAVLWAQVQPLCPPCHLRKTAESGDYRRQP